jgi:hypothetical protein
MIIGAIKNPRKARVQEYSLPAAAVIKAEASPLVNMAKVRRSLRKKTIVSMELHPPPRLGRACNLYRKETMNLHIVVLRKISMVLPLIHRVLLLPHHERRYRALPHVVRDEAIPIGVIPRNAAQVKLYRNETMNLHFVVYRKISMMFPCLHRVLLLPHHERHYRRLPHVV